MGFRNWLKKVVGASRQTGRDPSREEGNRKPAKLQKRPPPGHAAGKAPIRTGQEEGEKGIVHFPAYMHGEVRLDEGGTYYALRDLDNTGQFPVGQGMHVPKKKTDNLYLNGASNSKHPPSQEEPAPSHLKGLDAVAFLRRTRGVYGAREVGMRENFSGYVMLVRRDATEEFTRLHQGQDPPQRLFAPRAERAGSGSTALNQSPYLEWNAKTRKWEPWTSQKDGPLHCDALSCNYVTHYYLHNKKHFYKLTNCHLEHQGRPTGKPGKLLALESNSLPSKSQDVMNLAVHRGVGVTIDRFGDRITLHPQREQTLRRTENDLGIQLQTLPTHPRTRSTDNLPRKATASHQQGDWNWKQRTGNGRSP
jgi:hypothetical protein